MVDKKIPLILSEKKPQKDVKLDPGGFFVIEVDEEKKQIRVEHYSNVYKNKRIVTGSLQRVFVGEKADALCDTILKHVPSLQPDHYLYLGRELQRAQCALKNDKKYVQGGC